MATVVFASGGTGGHIIPALATAKLLQEKNPETEITFIGSGSDIEKQLMQNSPFGYLAVNSSPLVGKGVLGIVKFLSNVYPILKTLRKTFHEKDVKVVLGFGGYPSALPVFAAFLSGIPRIIFEQNGKVGLANKCLTLIANKIFAVPGVKSILFRKPKIILNPVRDDIKTINVKPKSELPIKILVFGGSQGAIGLNTAITMIVDKLTPEKCELVHQTGQKDFERVSKIYSDKINLHAFPYIENMQAIIKEADLLICRAGASTVSEVTAARKAVIFVPLSISRSHQKYNVIHLVKGGAAFMLEQNENLDKALGIMLSEIFESPETLLKMHEAYSNISELKDIQDGAEALTNCIQDILLHA